MRHPRALAYGLLTATTVVWGSTFTLVKSALHDASPLLFNLLRMTLATAVLAIFNWRALRRITRRELEAGALAGLFLAAGYELQTVGLTRTSPTASAFITGLVVVFVPALTLVPAFRPQGTPRPGLSAGVGAVLAFGGLLLLTAPPHAAPGDLLSGLGPGDLLTLGCALGFAAHLLTLAHKARHMLAGTLATLQIGFAAAFMLLALPLEQPHASWTPRLLGSLAIASVFATAAAFTIQSYAQKHLPPSHTVLLLTLEPVFAWLTSLLVLGEGLGGRQLLGAGLILASILIIEFFTAAQPIEIPA